MKQFAISILIIVLICSCKSETIKYPFKTAEVTSSEIPGFVNLVALSLELENDKYLVFTESKDFEFLINSFEVINDSKCLKNEKEYEKWLNQFKEDPLIKPFEKREDFIYGELVFNSTDRVHSLGFTFCKKSKTNISKIANLGQLMQKIDTTIEKREALDTHYKEVQSSNQYVLRYLADNSLSYYKKLDEKYVH
ncbi:hypothetical protein [Roseivirga pacifica]